MFKVFIFFLLLLLIWFLRHALMPLFAGIIMAYIIEPYVAYLQRKVLSRRGPCIAIAYLSIFAIITFLIIGFANIITGEIRTGSLQNAVSSLLSHYKEYEEMLNHVLGFYLKKPDIPSIVQDIGDTLVTILIGTIISIYLLKDKELFLSIVKKGLHLFLPQKIHGIIRELSFEIDKVITSFLRGVFVDSVIVAFLSSLVLSFSGLEFAVFIGCFAGILNIIPYFGPVLGMIPAGLMGFSQGGFTKALLSVGLLCAVQQIECNLIYPKIIGKSTGLHPLFVLISVSIAGYFGGLIWMILAVPIAGILNVLIQRWAECQ